MFFLYIVSCRLAVTTLLNVKPGQATILMAIVCSSWTVVNMGTSGRHVTHPLGIGKQGGEAPNYVAEANIMASRHLAICNPF